MHYKYLNNNVRTFVEFLDQSICALFRPAPRIFTLAPPRWKKLRPAHSWYQYMNIEMCAFSF